MKALLFSIYLILLTQTNASGIKASMSLLGSEATISSVNRRLPSFGANVKSIMGEIAKSTVANNLTARKNLSSRLAQMGLKDRSFANRGTPTVFVIEEERLVTSPTGKSNEESFQSNDFLKTSDFEELSTSISKKYL